MAVISRREVVRGVACIASSVVTARHSFAQAGLTAEQKAAYAKVFAAKGASPQELKVLRALQEIRRSVPLSIEAMKDFAANAPEIKALAAGQTPELGVISLWNKITLDATSADHTTDTPASPPPTYGEQFGPTRSSRALAIVHIAIFEAVNVIERKYKSYGNIQSQVLAKLALPIDQITSNSASLRRAATEAAYQSLASLYPNKRSVFDVSYNESVVQIGDGEEAKEIGRKIGLYTAEAVLALRSVDGASRPDLSADDFESNNPLDWRQDHVVPLPVALGGNWPRVRPFVLDKAELHRPPPPPQVNDPGFIDAFKQVKRLGGDPQASNSAPRRATATTRKGAVNTPPFDDENESFKGVFWAYDGTAALCAPPRLYNMVATSIATREKKIDTAVEFARFLALINVAMADACIAAWEAKYYYMYARPVTAIRLLKVDDTPEGAMDAMWTPLGAPVTNGGVQDRNLTPPFPAYPSGHATFGGALFEMMRLYWKLDISGVAFDFVSDEYNGHNRGPGDSQARDKVTRHFPSFEAAEIENGFSRVWLGIHWNFDSTAGIEQGRKVAREVYSKIWSPVS